MLRFRASFLLLVSLAACGGGSANTSASSAQAAAPAGSPSALDGTSYDVVLEIPGETVQKDTIQFSNGRFESALCTPLGFPKWTEYTARPEGDAMAFHVLTKHPTGTTMDWNGIVKGETVEGTVTRTMNGKTGSGTFRGTLHR